MSTADVAKLLDFLESIQKRLDDVAHIHSGLYVRSPITKVFYKIVNDIAAKRAEFGDNINLDTNNITDKEFQDLLEDSILSPNLSEKDQKLLDSKPHIVQTVRF